MCHIKAGGLLTSYPTMRFDASVFVDMMTYLECTYDDIDRTLVRAWMLDNFPDDGIPINVVKTKVVEWFKDEGEQLKTDVVLSIAAIICVLATCSKTQAINILSPSPEIYETVVDLAHTLELGMVPITPGPYKSGMALLTTNVYHQRRYREDDVTFTYQVSNMSSF
jgi:hypothetical protein